MANSIFVCILIGKPEKGNVLVACQVQRKPLPQELRDAMKTILHPDTQVLGV